MTKPTAKERTLVFQGTPVSLNSLYWHRGRFRYVTDEGKNWKSYVALTALAQWKGKPLSGRLNVRFILYFKDKRARDLCNYEKAICDSLTGIVWTDDSLIDFISFERGLDKNNPRIEVKVCEITST